MKHHCCIIVTVIIPFLVVVSTTTIVENIATASSVSIILLYFLQIKSILIDGIKKSLILLDKFNSIIRWIASQDSYFFIFLLSKSTYVSIFHNLWMYFVFFITVHLGIHDFLHYL